MVDKKTITSLLSLFALNIYAAGETGLATLKIGVGARSAALGEAFVAVADDATALFWNPAGTTRLSQRQAHLTHNKWLQGVNNNAASVIFPSSAGAFGVGVMLNSVDEIERRVIASEEPLGTFSAHDFSFILSYARRIKQKLSAGISAKYINEKIYIHSASGFALDVGGRYEITDMGLVAAVCLQNFGFTTKMNTENIQLPTTIRAGLAYRLPVTLNNSSWLVTADFVHILEDKSHINVGSEFFPLPSLTLRIGYQTGYEEKTISAGAGVKINRFSIDYAYVPFDRNLGNTQRFSVSAEF